MENGILDALQDIGYEGPLKEEVGLVKALEGGPKSTEFTKLVTEVCRELRLLCGFEKIVNATKDSDEASSFLLELSSFLEEMGCPYTSLVTGQVSARLQSRDDRMLLLDYLLSELMAARMIKEQNPLDKMDMEITINDSPMAKDLKDILIALGVNKLAPNITAEMLFSTIEEKLKELIQQKGPSVVGRPLFNEAIAPTQWSDLETHFTTVYDEFKIRREKLIAQLDNTIRSFEVSDRTQTKREQIQMAYQPFRETMKTQPDVQFSDLLAARDTLLHVEKVSSANGTKHTTCEINKVVIGGGQGGCGGGPADRGGRGGGSGSVQGDLNNGSRRYSGAARRRYRKKMSEWLTADTEASSASSKPEDGISEAPGAPKRLRQEPNTLSPSHQVPEKRPKISDRGSYAQTTEGLVRLALIIRGYPDKKLKSGDIIAIRDKIVDAIMEIPKGTKAPSFTGSREWDGALVISCADEETGNWLRSVSADLLVRGESLCVLPADELHKRHRVMVHAEGPHFTAEKALLLLGKQNPGLKSDEWVIPRGKTKMNASSVQFPCLVSSSSLAVLRACNFRPYCGLTRALVRLLDSEPS